MDQLISRLLLYADPEEDSLLTRLSDCFTRWKEGKTPGPALIRAIFDQVRQLVELGAEYGFTGNLWQNYLTFLLMTNENAFSLSAERTEAPEGTVSHFAKADLRLFRALFHFDFSPIESALGIDCFSVLCQYTAGEMPAPHQDRRIGEKIRALSVLLAQAEDEEAFFARISEYYAACGVGQLGLNSVFRVRAREDRAELIPVSSADTMTLRDLVGYEEQKRRLCANTEAFLRGDSANHVLLYGDAGTGKSTSVKALLHEYDHCGLRMIELYKHQLRALPDVMTAVKNRRYRFILFLDDLSFEENELEYKFLKAVMEGSAETIPDNLLLYATSNRRHLVRETWRDRGDMEIKDDIHHSDTLEEKLSLAARFGVQIHYGCLNYTQFQHTVLELAHRQGITLPDAQLLAAANKWELYHSGRSGRTAQQFLRSLSGIGE